MENISYKRPPELEYSNPNSPITFFQLSSDYFINARRDPANSLLFGIKFIFECDCETFTQEQGTNYCSIPCTTPNCEFC
jgi:hypothetical protein